MTYYSAKYVLFNFIHFQIFKRSFHNGEMVTVLQGYVLLLVRVTLMLVTNVGNGMYCVGDFKILTTLSINVRHHHSKDVTKIDILSSASKNCQQLYVSNIDVTNMTVIVIKL